AGLEISDTRTAREGDYDVEYVSGDTALVDLVNQTVSSQLENLGQGRLAVIAPDPLILQLWTVLGADSRLAPLLRPGASSPLPTGASETPASASGTPDDASASAEPLPYAASSNGLLAPITIMTAQEAKGLEFDIVIVVEPAQIAAQRGRGS